MNKKLRIALTVLLSAVFVFSAGKFALTQLDYQKGASDYQDAAQLADLPQLPQAPPQPPQPEAAPPPAADPPAQTPPSAAPDSSAPDASAPDASEPQEQPPEPEPEQPVYVDPYADALRDMDFTALRQVNDDVVGWILIPGTNLSYPLLQGDDNDYYLNHTWRQARNSVGGIFLDYRDSRDLSDFHSIIYGHRVNNGTMFGQLHSYKDSAHLAAHPSFYIADDNGSHRYEIFAVYEANSTNTYMQEFSGDNEKQAFLNYCMDKSIYDTGVIPTTADRVVTLSTCTGHGHSSRWVIQGVLHTPS